MDSPVSPIVANLYMEEVESRPLSSFKGTLSHWFRYVDDILVKMKTQEVETFTKHLNSLDSNIKFTREDMRENRLPFPNCAIHHEKDGGLNIQVYQKPIHTEPYVILNSTALWNTSWKLSENL